jgi:hypothetical protein
MRVFGRRHAPDRRDRKYAIAPRKSARTYRYWQDDQWSGDQKQTPQCVGFAWAHLLSASPVSQFVRPEGIYELAKFRDEFAGEKYEGTSVRGAAKVLASLGFFAQYRWALTVQDIVNCLLDVGPVVMGTDWLAGMDSPDAAGYVHATGAARGGHAWLLTGVNVESGVARMKNSWGLAWGQNGHAWITLTDLAVLLKRKGEACLPWEITPGPA